MSFVIRFAILLNYLKYHNSYISTMPPKYSRNTAFGFISLSESVLREGYKLQCILIWNFHYLPLNITFSTSRMCRSRFLSSPSACRTSGASKNRDWPDKMLKIWDHFPLWICHYLMLVPWGSLGVLTNFFDNFFWQIFLTNFILLEDFCDL